MAPLADSARSRGYRVAAPDLTAAVEPPPPVWKRLVAEALKGAGDLPAPVLLIGHSGAGAFLPQIGARMAARMEAMVFVDAVLPPTSGSHETTADMKELLREKTVEGRLLPWLDWWPQATLDRILPGSEDRRTLRTDMPRLDPFFYDEPVPVPPGWSEWRCAYLQSSPAYSDEAADARARRWPQLSIDGTHLSLFTEPDVVFEAVGALVEGAAWGSR